MKISINSQSEEHLQHKADYFLLFTLSSGSNGTKCNRSLSDNVGDMTDVGRNQCSTDSVVELDITPDHQTEHNITLNHQTEHDVIPDHQAVLDNTPDHPTNTGSDCLTAGEVNLSSLLTGSIPALFFDVH